jgi:NAD(P)-dependent dehydrogenase (short-subunit alcohol dehydrogenase family)
VIVASLLSEGGKLNFDDLLLEKEDPETSKAKAYGNSKLANIVFSKELASRLAGTGVHTYALCPGWVKTNLARHIDLNWKSYLFMIPAVFLFMRTPHQV